MALKHFVIDPGFRLETIEIDSNGPATRVPNPNPDNITGYPLIPSVTGNVTVCRLDRVVDLFTSGLSITESNLRGYWVF